MKEGWEIKKMVEIAEVTTGKWDANHSNENGKYRFYTCAYNHGRCDTNRFSGESLILPGNGVNVGEVFYYDGEFDAYQRTYVVNNIQIYPKYLHYHMLLFWKELGTKLQYGSATNFIKIGNFQDYNVAFPPLADQQRIVSILDKAFAAIDKAKANAEQNLKNAKELFESYLQGVFENGGEGWEEKTLGEVLVKTETTDPTKKPNEEFIYLDVSSVNKETKEIENSTVLLGKDAPSRARKLIRTNDVIFATVRPTHSRVALIPEEYNEQVCSTGYFVLRAKDFLSNNLVFYFLLTYSFNQQMEKLQKGASYPAVTDSEVKGIYIPFPKSRKDQQAIVQKFDALSVETKKLEAIYRQKINDLEELKKSILQKAFSGELTNEIQATIPITASMNVPRISSTDLQAGIISLSIQRREEKWPDKPLGHVKAEKIVHMAEAYLGIELDRKPFKDAAGPNDFPTAKKVESRAAKAGFFTVLQAEGRYTYQAGNHINKLVEKTRTSLGNKLEALNDLLDLMLPMKTQQAEIVATLFAAWNNLLIDGVPINDEAIVYEARENWHPDKLKIERERFFNALQWMREQQIIPVGKGKKVLSKQN